jgi:hypothetical protein
MQTKNRTRGCIPIAILCVAFTWWPTIASARQGDAAILDAGGIHASKFCTKTGNITVVHTVYHDANGGAAVGQTHLTAIGGGGEYRLVPGNAKIAKGCYKHDISNSTVYGTGKITSTVWYD